VRDSKADLENGKPARKSRAIVGLLVLSLFALAGYYYGFQLDEEKRSRLNKLMFEGREMWFRLFV
jgi:hypothetical protein